MHTSHITIFQFFLRYLTQSPKCAADAIEWYTTPPSPPLPSPPLPFPSRPPLSHPPPYHPPSPSPWSLPPSRFSPQENVGEVIGNTPMVYLNKIGAGLPARVAAKCEVSALPSRTITVHPHTNLRAVTWHPSPPSLLPLLHFIRIPSLYIYSL